MTDHRWVPPSEPHHRGGTGSPPGWSQPPGHDQHLTQYGPAYGAPHHAQPPYGHGFAPLPTTPQPGVIPLRALNVGDILSGATKTIRGNPGATIGLSMLLMLIPPIPFAVLAGVLSQADLGSREANEILSSLLGLGVWLGLMFGVLLLTGLLTTVVSQAVLGRRVTMAQAWRSFKGRTWATIGASLLVGLITVMPMVLVALIITPIAVASSDLAGYLSVPLVLVALAAVIYLVIRIHFAIPITVLERSGPIAAVRRSWVLTEGQWWRIFGINLLMQTLVSIVLQVAMFPAFLLIGLSLAMASSGSATALAIVLAISGSAIFLAILGMTTPFMSGVLCLLYLDQRIRKEALDVTLMAAVHEAQGTSYQGGTA